MGKEQVILLSQKHSRNKSTQKKKKKVGKISPKCTNFILNLKNGRIFQHAYIYNHKNYENHHNFPSCHIMIPFSRASA